MDVKCAGCNRYFPLSRVMQDEHGYYCKTCFKKRRAEQRRVVEGTATCIFCNKDLKEGDWHTIGGYRYCRECSEKIARGGKHEPSYKCAICGEPISVHEVRMVRDGKEFCEKCYRETFDTDGKEKTYRCSQCGKELTRFQVKMRMGANYCEGCYGEMGPIETLIKKTIAKGDLLTPEELERTLMEPPRQASGKPDEKAFGETAQLFKCLGDPCRVKIIESLADHNMSVFAFVEMTGFQYSAISYHLKMLKDMGLVYSFRSGNFQVYSLTKKGSAVHEFIAKSIELK